MEIYIADNYEEMSKQAASAVKTLIESKSNALLCTASGDTPAGLYKELVRLTKDDKLDVSACNFIGLDEWVGMNGEDEGSCRYYIDKQLFHPLQLAAQKICFFDGRSNDLAGECEAAENFILQHKGIDVAIVGLGMNGHIGMNEPGTPAAIRCHVTDLDPLTIKTGQKYFKKSQELTRGVTLGLADLMEAREIIILVSGRHKAAIVKRMLEEEISEQLPASLFRGHKGLKIYLDNDAASLIHSLT